MTTVCLREVEIAATHIFHGLGVHSVDARYVFSQVPGRPTLDPVAGEGGRYGYDGLIGQQKIAFEIALGAGQLLFLLNRESC